MSRRDSVSEIETAGNIEQDRIVMLSDGVFAIAITLLVLDIKLPSGNVDDLYGVISSMLPSFTGYTISFVVIASYWLGHRKIMKALARINRNFLWLNFVFLFFVTVFPVPTALLAQHFGVVSPTIIYACFSAATGLSLWLLWMYASWADLLVKRVDIREIRFRSMFYLGRSLIYLASLLILFVPYGPYIFFILWLGLVPLLLYILRNIFRPHILARKREHEAHNA